MAHTTIRCPKCGASGAERCTTETGLDHIARTRAFVAQSEARSPRIYEQGATTYVIGTSDMQAAAAALGISAETHRWGSTISGMFVRRQGMWRETSDLRTPKDAKPGVGFIGRIRPIEEA